MQGTPTVGGTHIAWDRAARVREVVNWVGSWLDVVARPDREVEMLPYNYRITSGRYDSGHVIVLHTEDNSFMYAVPAEVILLLQRTLPDNHYRTPLEREPRLSTLAGG